MSHIVTLDSFPLSRSYLLHLPPGSGPWPVVVLLHGAGGTAEWSLAETRWHLLADREGFALLLPEATRPDPEQPPGFLFNPQVWNDGYPAGEPARPALDDVAFILACLDDAARREPLDRSRVYLTGFSNGAAMAFRVAAERAERFAALAPVAGYCHVRDPRPARPVPTLYVVGAVDPLVPLAGGEIVTPWRRTRMIRPPVREGLERWARGLGCEAVARTVRREEGLTIEEYPGPVPFLTYTIDELGHHWPGGRGELNRRIAGPPSNRLDGCALAWEFFRTWNLGEGGRIGP